MAGRPVGVAQAARRRRHERLGDLRGDFQGGGHVQRTITADAFGEGLAFDEFHRVEAAARFRGRAVLEDVGDVRVTQAGGGAGLAQEAFAHRVAAI